MKKFILIVLSLVAFGAAAGERPIPRGQWNDEVKLWVARSCAGEAGFDAVDECMGIAWVYATRWRLSKNRSFLDMVLRYSAAIKYRSTHTRRWIMNLNLSAQRPVGWPYQMEWKNHKRMWQRILSALDEWAEGKRPNPVYGADHFGGHMDKPQALWVPIKPASDVKFRNIFYRSPQSPDIVSID